MSLIYSLVSRGKDTVLTSYSSFQGNFPQIAQDVLKKCNTTKTFGQYGTANYNFYTFIKQGFVFLVMVEANYETRIAVSFLKKIQEQFFKKYDATVRNTSVAHSLKDFVGILSSQMNIYNDPTKIDKMSQLKKQLTSLEQNALQNMTRVIQRGQKIQILVKKSQTLSEQSYDLHGQSKRIRRHMWWKNKKIMVGVVLVIIVILFLIMALALGWF